MIHRSRYVQLMDYDSTRLDYQRGHPFLLRFLTQSHSVVFISQIHHLLKAQPSLPLSQKNVPHLKPEENCHDYSQQFIDSLGELDQVTEGPLLWSLVSMNWASFLYIQCLLLCELGLRLASSILLNVCLGEVAEGRAESGLRWGAGCCACVVVSKVCQQNGMSEIQLLMNRMRMTLVGGVFSKMVRLSQNTINRRGLAKLISLISGDMNNLEYKIIFVCYSLCFPLLLGGVCAVVILRCGWPGIFGPLFILCVLPVSLCVGRKSGQIQREIKSTCDQRIKFTKELIEIVRLVKMCGWQSAFARSIKALRSHQCSLYLRNLLCIAYDKSIVSVVSTLSSFLIFAAMEFSSGGLTLAVIFSTLDLMAFFRFNFMLSVLGLNFAFEVRVIASRFCQVFHTPAQTMILLDPSPTWLPPPQAIAFQKFSAFWTKDTPTLSQINLSFQRGRHYAVVGKVGSGKSTLLQSILQDVPFASGNFSVDGKLAYLEQQPVIFAGTVRQNILFGRPFDEERYRLVTKACCLERDLKLMPNRDDTEIGERGINISGGQKARICLARTVYQDSDYYLLDDPISAVDSKVARTIFKRVIKGLLRDRGVIFVTHQLSYASQMGEVVMLDQGKVVAQGEKSLPQGQKASLESVLSDQVEDEQGQYDQERGKLIIEEQKEDIQVTKDTIFRTYFGASQRWLVFMTAALVILAEGCNIMVYRLYGYFAIAKQGELGLSLSGYFGFVLAVILAQFLLNLGKYFCLGTLLFSNFESLHNGMLQSVLGARVGFFDRVPNSRLVNRFSNDINILDNSLLVPSMDIVEGFVTMVSMLINIFIITPIVAVPGAFLVCVLALMLYVVRPVNTACRSLELRVKSQVFQFINKSLGSMRQVRLLGKEEYFQGRVFRELELACRANNAFWFSSRFFSFYIGLLGNVIYCCGILLGIQNSTEGRLGTSISYLNNVTQSLIWFSRQMLSIEALLVSARRIINYNQLDQEERLDDQGQSDESKGEPMSEGALVLPKVSSRGIEFRAVSLRYRSNLDLVLKKVSFKLQKGERVAVVGRTGAGKSSILQALFRMVEIDEGSVVVDGMRAEEYRLNQLRNRFSIIPQTACVFMGTIRRNLDPFQQYTNEDVQAALRLSGLSDYVSSLPLKVDTEVGENGELFSMGQKQLLCLARCLLKRAEYLVLDQATSNVDMETDKFIQDCLKTHFAGTTILTVAHRLNTVADYDRVLVMEGGEVVEQGSPVSLLVQREQDPEITRDSLFAQMVRQTGEQNSKAILQIARRK